MKLHSDILDHDAICDALKAAKDNGKVTPDVHFVKFDRSGSRSRKMACDIQLGTYDKTSGPTKSRHYKNSGQHGATSEYGTGDSIWAATWDEWGWFIAEIFKRDANAIFGTYVGVNGFHSLTDNKFRDTLSEWP